jgi:hypothetical protein
LPTFVRDILIRSAHLNVTRFITVDLCVWGKARASSMPYSQRLNAAAEVQATADGGKAAKALTSAAELNVRHDTK